MVIKIEMRGMFSDLLDRMKREDILPISPSIESVVKPIPQIINLKRGEEISWLAT